MASSLTRKASRSRIVPRALFRALRHRRRGSVSVEWALVALPLLVLVLGLFELTYDLYAQEALDMALQSSARLIATGSIQGTANSIATFESLAFCPAVSPLLPCTSMLVNIRPVASFAAGSPTALPITNGSLDSSGFTYCPGQPQQLMMAQAIYPAPSFITRLLPVGLSSYNGETVRLIVSNAGFVNEPYTPTAPPPAGC